MRKIVTGLFMSLDGVVEADDDWQFAYFDEELFEGITAGWDVSSKALRSGVLEVRYTPATRCSSQAPAAAR